VNPAHPAVVRKQALDDIDDKARVWTVTRGADGKLADELDVALLLKLNPDHSAEQIADALILAAATADIAASRAW
jgi:hypothetical protein